MITLENGRTLQNDVVLSLIIRSDTSPIPVTMEADVRDLEGVEKWMQEGRSVSVGKYEFSIAKSRLVSGGLQQGDRETGGWSITCVMKGLRAIGQPMARNVFKDDPTIGECYRLSGSEVNVSGDVRGVRFALLRGDVPSIMINRVLQEAGAIVRWKNGNAAALRFDEVKAQKPIRYLPDIQGADDEQGYVVRTIVPQYVSIDREGVYQEARRNIAAPVVYVPLHGANALRLMQQVLVQKKVARIMLDMNIDAGDIVDVNGERLMVITAAHVPIDGYTKLWLGAVE